MNRATILWLGLLGSAVLLSAPGCDGDDGTQVCDPTIPTCVNGGGTGGGAGTGGSGTGGAGGSVFDPGGAGTGGTSTGSGIFCSPGSSSTTQCSPGTTCCSSNSQCSELGQSCPF